VIRGPTLCRMASQPADPCAHRRLLLAALALGLACGDNTPALIASTLDAGAADGARADVARALDEGGGGDGGGNARDSGDAGADVPAPLVAPDLGPHCAGCARAPVGHPTWEPKGAVVLVGGVGSASAGSGALVSFLGDLFQPNHRFFMREFSIGPAQPHDGPYDDEAFALAVAAGVTPRQRLTTADYTAPSGVVVIINVVPGKGAPSGSSFDFDSGPILPNARFPIHVLGSLLREGAPLELFDSYYLGYDQFMPAIAKDGPSHLFVLVADNSSFVPGVPAAGHYELHIQAVDETGDGAGWNMIVPFVVGD